MQYQVLEQKRDDEMLWYVLNQDVETRKLSDDIQGQFGVWATFGPTHEIEYSVIRLNESHFYNQYSGKLHEVLVEAKNNQDGKALETLYHEAAHAMAAYYDIRESKGFKRVNDEGLATAYGVFMRYKTMLGFDDKFSMEQAGLNIIERAKYADAKFADEYLRPAAYAIDYALTNGVSLEEMIRDFPDYRSLEN